MRILLLTSIYPADDMPKGVTPVVHYFVKEWVQMGHEVKVIHYVSVFPRIYYMISKFFATFLSSHVGYVVPVRQPKSMEYTIDGVNVKRFGIRKRVPHGRYSSQQVDSTVEKTIDYCKKESFHPDVIIGHWTNPQIEIISKIKERFDVPSVLVFHGGGGELKSLYPTIYEKLLTNIDLLGFRCKANKEKFEKNYGIIQKRWFYCYSGIPSSFINDKMTDRDFKDVRRFVYVGSLIKRKYPDKIIPALIKVYPMKDFVMNYVGEGKKYAIVQKQIENCNLEDCVHLRGRIDRGEVKKYLEAADVFIMISKGEVYGLVYLEAMATGCIPIASRGEGFDGIIQDGINGFLSEAGNVDELVKVITKIRRMSSKELQKISQNAILTAQKLTDRQVAIDYLQNVQSVLKR